VHQTLSAYAVDSRYPDIFDPDAQALANEAVAACERICGAVARELRQL
jgi:hypothetical protein